MALKDREVLLLDGQTTGASPRQGQLLELCWARTRASDAGPLQVEGGLVSLPSGETIPRRITQLTGVSMADMEAAEPALSRLERLQETAVGMPVVAHYARFERGFLNALCDEEGAGLRWVCTHEIARRLFPELPRRGLRALAGFFGFGLGELKRAGPHVEATHAVWRGVLEVLESEEGVTTLEELETWLKRVRARRGERHVYPMPRTLRLGLPEGPGIYRMLGVEGRVLYLGKATSLRQRVNSYFQKQRSHGSEKTLELLTRARDLSVTEVATPLEAALLEADEIKRLSPPYNVALRGERRGVCFVDEGLGEVSACADAEHGVGPLPSERLGLRVGALLRAWRGERVAAEEVLEPGFVEAPDEACWEAGLEGLRARYGVVGGRLSLQRLGTELWRARKLAQEATAEEEEELEEEEETEDDVEAWVWTPEAVEVALERWVRRWAWMLRRGRVLCALSESKVVWRPRGWDEGARRVLLISRGRVERRLSLGAGQVWEVGPRGRGWLERQRCMDGATYDRLRVLTTELRRVLAEGGAVCLELSGGRLEEEELRRLLWWM